MCFREGSMCFREGVQKGCWGLRGCGHPRPLGWIPARDFGHLRNGGSLQEPHPCFWLTGGRLDWQFAGRSACWLSCWFRGGSACSLRLGGSLDWVLVSRDGWWCYAGTCYAADGWCLDWGFWSGRGCRLTSGGGAVVGTEPFVLQPLDCKIMGRLLMVTNRPSGPCCNEVCCIPHWQSSQSRLERVRCGGQA